MKVWLRSKSWWGRSGWTSRERLARFAAAVVLLATVGACSSAGRPAVRPGRQVSSVVASWYGPGYHGRHTASGEVYDMHGLTAAHKTLPFGTRLKVTHVHNQRSVVVKINDRGPFIRGRDLDLSYGAAQALGMVDEGVSKVRVERLR